MSVFDNRRNDVSDALDEIYRTPAIILAADLTELSARSARLERERDEERAARLKAQAERDAAQAEISALHRESANRDSLGERLLSERDSALALLSKAREARDRAQEAAECLEFSRGDTVDERANLRSALSDLTKILGTGETT